MLVLMRQQVPGYSGRTRSGPALTGLPSLAPGRSEDKIKEAFSVPKLSQVNRYRIRLVTVLLYLLPKIMQLMHLFLAGQSSQSTAGLPVRNDAPGVLIRREEAHNPAWNHVTDVGQNPACLVHLSTKKINKCKLHLYTLRTR